MYTGDFISGLKRLNPNLHVDRDNTTYSHDSDQGSCGLYYKASDYEYKKLLRQAGSNETPLTYLDYVASHYIPYTNVYNEKGEVVKRGLREILLNLIKRGYLTHEKTKKVFNIGSLGEYDWDNLSYQQKKERYLKDAKRNPGLH